MIKKICPICDLPVNEMNYCSFCKKYVRRPKMIEVDYYLNENHPDFEIDCDYHNMPEERQRYGENRQQGGQGNRGKQPAGNHGQQSLGNRGQQSAGNRGQQPAGNRRAQSIGNHGQQSVGNRGVQPAGKQPGQKSAPKTNKIAVLVVCLIIVMYSLAIVGNSLHTTQKSSNSITINEVIDNLVVDTPISEDNNTEAYISDDDYADYGDYANQFKELTDEEVKAAGLECTGYDHFSIDGNQISEEMHSYIASQDYGYEVERDSYTSNIVDEGEDLTYYYLVDIFIMTDPLTEDELGYQYVDLSYDNVSGRLHDYNSALENDEASLDYLKHFLETAEEYAEIGDEDSRITEIMEIVQDSIVNRKDEEILEGMFYIDIYCEDSITYIYAAPNSEAWADQEL